MTQPRYYLTSKAHGKETLYQVHDRELKAIVAERRAVRPYVAVLFRPADADLPKKPARISNGYGRVELIRKGIKKDYHFTDAVIEELMSGEIIPSGYCLAYLEEEADSFHQHDLNETLQDEETPTTPAEETEIQGEIKFLQTLVDAVKDDDPANDPDWNEGQAAKALLREKQKSENRKRMEKMTPEQLMLELEGANDMCLDQLDEIQNLNFEIKRLEKNRKGIIGDIVKKDIQIAEQLATIKDRTNDVMHLTEQLEQSKKETAEAHEAWQDEVKHNIEVLHAKNLEIQELKNTLATTQSEVSAIVETLKAAPEPTTESPEEDTLYQAYKAHVEEMSKAPNSTPIEILSAGVFKGLLHTGSKMVIAGGRKFQLSKRFDADRPVAEQRANDARLEQMANDIRYLWVNGQLDFLLQ